MDCFKKPHTHTLCFIVSVSCLWANSYSLSHRNETSVMKVFLLLHYLAWKDLLPYRPNFLQVLRLIVAICNFDSAVACSWTDPSPHEMLPHLNISKYSKRPNANKCDFSDHISIILAAVFFIQQGKQQGYNSHAVHPVWVWTPSNYSWKSALSSGNDCYISNF